MHCEDTTWLLSLKAAAITVVLSEIITFTAAAGRPIRADAHGRLAELLTPKSPPFLVPDMYSLHSLSHTHLSAV